MVDAAIGTVSIGGTSTTTQADGVTLTNVDAATGVTMAGATNLDLTVTYDAAALAGATTAKTLTLSGATFTAAADFDVTYTAGVETLTIDSVGGTANKVGDVVWGGPNLTITGSQNLTINDALAVTATTVDASAASGKVSVSVGNSNDKAAVAGVDVTDQVIKGGSGNDTIVTAGDDALEVTIEAGAGDDKITPTAMPVKATLTKNADKIDGGEGNDTLILTKTLAQAAAKANNVTISNIETVQISDGSDGATTLLNIQSGLAQITLRQPQGVRIALFSLQVLETL